MSEWLPSRPKPERFPTALSLMDAIRARQRVVNALMLRELATRFGRENLGYVWLFVEPALLGVGVAIWQLASGGDSTMPGGMNKFSFFLIGYTVFYLFRVIVSRSPRSVAGNYQLLFHARVSIEAVVWARNLLDAGAVAICITFFVVLIGMVSGQWPSSPLQMVGAVILMLLLAHGTGLVFLAGTAIGAELVDRIAHPFTYLVIPFSGMFYMVWWLPPAFQSVFLWSPVVHIMEIMREGQFGRGVPYHYDLPFLITWIVVLNFVGLCALKAAKPHLDK